MIKHYLFLTQKLMKEVIVMVEHLLLHVLLLDESQLLLFKALLFVGQITILVR